MIKTIARKSYESLLAPGMWTTVHAMGGEWNMGIGWKTENEAEASYRLAYEQSHTCMIVAPNGDITRIHDGLV